MKYNALLDLELPRRRRSVCGDQGKRVLSRVEALGRRLVSGSEAHEKSKSLWRWVPASKTCR